LIFKLVTTGTHNLQLVITKIDLIVNDNFSCSYI